MKEAHHVPFSSLTTFKVGGTARRVLYAEDKDECASLIADLEREGSRYLILGGGSNVLAPDGEYDGTIVIPSFKETTYAQGEGDDMHVYVSAGVSWDSFVDDAVTRGLWGVENLSAIPGSMGGAVVQNIGAYGAVLSDVLHSVEVYDIHDKVIKTLTRDECAFGYRTSIFKEQRHRYVVLGATLVLTTAYTPRLSYRDLAETFADTSSASVQEVRRAVQHIRKGKFPDLAEYGTAGSFFLNPVVSEEDAEEFQAQYPGMPVFPMPEGGVKVPLAWILDHVLQVKEMREGGAFVWGAQALVLVAESGAHARDVRALAEKIRALVYEKLSITVSFEVCIVDE